MCINAQKFENTKYSKPNFKINKTIFIFLLFLTKFLEIKPYCYDLQM